MTDIVKQNVGEQTANDQSKSAKKNAVKRSAIGSVNETILSFIMRSTPYECDAIRVAITAMREAREMEQLSASETTFLNRYMNEGLAKDASISSRTVRKHRQKMAGQLLSPLSDFLEHKGDVAVASALLSDFANDDTFVDEALAAVKQDAGMSADKPAASDGKPVDNVRQGDKQSDSKPHANAQQSGSLFSNHG